MSIQTWVWIKEKSQRELRPLQTIWAGSAICTAGERCCQVGIVGSLPGREQKAGATSALILTHEIWDGTSALSSAHPYFSGVVLLWQQATEANCVGSSQTGNLHGPPFVCLFWHGCLFFFSCSRAMTWNRSWIRHCRARFFPCYWTQSSHHLIEAYFFCSSPMLKHSRNTAFLLHVTQFFIIFS